MSKRQQDIAESMLEMNLSRRQAIRMYEAYIRMWKAKSRNPRSYHVHIGRVN